MPRVEAKRRVLGARTACLLAVFPPTSVAAATGQAGSRPPGVFPVRAALGPRAHSPWLTSPVVEHVAKVRSCGGEAVSTQAV